MAPVVHGLEAKWGEQVQFVYLNIDDPASETFKRQFGFVYQPHLLLLDGQGNVLQEWIGYAGGEELQQALYQASEAG